MKSAALLTLAALAVMIGMGSAEAGRVIRLGAPAKKPATTESTCTSHRSRVRFSSTVLPSSSRWIVSCTEVPTFPLTRAMIRARSLSLRMGGSRSPSTATMRSPGRIPASMAGPFRKGRVMVRTWFFLLASVAR